MAETIFQAIARPERPNTAHFRELERQARAAREQFYADHMELSEWATAQHTSRERALRHAITEGRAVKVENRWFIRREGQP